MKIKIIKCSKDTYWYRDFIDQTFEVLEDSNHENVGFYRVYRDEPSKAIGFIDVKDTIELSNKFDSLTSIVEQLELCDYVTRDNNHELKMNNAFISLKEMAKKEQNG